MKDQLICPICSDSVDKLLYQFHIESERAVLQVIKDKNPAWSEHDGLCGRCVDYYHTSLVMQQMILPEAGPYFQIKTADDFVILPTPLRLNADPRYTGKGVTICFIDSGYYPHPDLVATRNRIKLYVDITKSCKPISFDEQMQTGNASWHGTMTTVVCAGDGYLSNGLYKAIASHAALVLLKVQNEDGKITTANICKALHWILEHHSTYNINVVNMSVGDDEAISYKDSLVDELAGKIVANGITVVAAVGNSETAAIKPPANSPHVIAVGGIDDGNKLANESPLAYHSTYGSTIDGLMKPELVANAIWLAAPILPGTAEKEKAGLLHRLLQSTEETLANPGWALLEQAGIFYKGNDPSKLKEEIISQIQATKFFSPDYMHVDGTSFAAPIVCAVIAQLLEANPTLTPKQISNVLFSTARQLPGIATVRQGFGYIQPRKALLQILKNNVLKKEHDSPFIDRRGNTICFYIHHTCAAHICLAGSFNQWAQDELLMEAGRDGLWKIEIPILPAGKYLYKFLIDRNTWMEDVENPYRQHDGFDGWNSVLEIN